MARDRLLVVDADLPKSLSGSLKNRARDAISVAELGLSQNVKDPELLGALAALYSGQREWVLVTGDDMMPAEHGSVIIEARATVATISSDYPDGVKEHQWYCDVTHRWAHAMQEQQPRAVRRYSLTGSKVWKPRRRHIRKIAIDGLTPWRAEDVGAENGAADAAPSYEELRFPGLD